MRIAVISDIHGNCIGLEAVLVDFASDDVDSIVCLGDAIQGGPQPAQVVDQLRALGCPVVMGNADSFLLTGAETGNEPISRERLVNLRAVREWSLAQLSAEDRHFIEGFQPTVEISLSSSRRLLCFHGSPRSFDDIILPNTPDEEVQKLLGQYAPHILTGGHTHLQQIRELGSSFFFNPGSAGFAYSHRQTEENFRATKWAEYAVLTVDGERVRLEFRRVPFDVAALIRVYRESGRPYADEAIVQYQR